MTIICKYCKVPTNSFEYPAPCYNCGNITKKEEEVNENE